MAIKNVVIGGPLGSGTVRESGAPSGIDVGLAVLTQVIPISESNSTAAYDTIFYLPAGAHLDSIVVDTTTAFGATGGTLVVGKVSGATAGNQYLGPITASMTVGRAAAVALATANQYSLPATSGLSNVKVYATMTLTGSPTGAGRAYLVVKYIQN